MKRISRLLILPLFFAVHFSPSLFAQMKSSPVYNHSAYYVLDLKTSTDFYKNIIGLEQVAEPFHDGRHSWFGLGPGNGKLHIISGAKAKTEHDKNTHYCFSVPSVPEFTARLDKSGVAYESWAGEKGKMTNRVDGVKQIYLQDPDGYWIEINDEKVR